MKSIIVAIVLIVMVQLSAQVSLDNICIDSQSKNVISNPQIHPEYPGGQVALMKYIATFDVIGNANLNGSTGKIYASIVIDTFGRVTDVEIVKSSGDEMLDNAFVMHLQKMPNWKPGKLYGKVIATKYIIPLNCLKLSEWHLSSRHSQ